jgi:ATPase subunit of ABC transporter with duplicated ATPase domains
MKSAKDRDARSMGEKFRSSRAEASLSRAKNRRARALADAEAALEAVELEKTLGARIFVDYQPMPKPVIAQLDSLDLFAGPARILRDVRLTLRRGARIHVRGDNGAGKTTLLRAVLEHARLPEDRVLFLPQDSSREEDWARRELIAELPPKERGRVLSIVAALGVDPARVLESAAPSPGESQKLALALGLGRHAWLLVLDEPTNHLDLPSVERLEAAIAEFPGALLLVSHDHRFAERLTTEVWQLEDGLVEPS